MAIDAKKWRKKMITVFYSRKSAGKSTIAAQMASKLTLSGVAPIIVDADPQGTIGNWAVYRDDKKKAKKIPFVTRAAGADLRELLEELRERFDEILVDLQGNDSKENRLVLMMADRIVIPFRPTQPDLDNIPYIAEMLTELKELNPDVEVHFVINEAPYSQAKVTEVDEARGYFALYDLKASKTVLRSRKAYRDSMSQGLGVCELKDDKAKAEIESLWGEIYKKAIKRKAGGRRSSPANQNDARA